MLKDTAIIFIVLLLLLTLISLFGGCINYTPSLDSNMEGWTMYDAEGDMKEAEDDDTPDVEPFDQDVVDDMPEPEADMEAPVMDEDDMEEMDDAPEMGMEDEMPDSMEGDQVEPFYCGGNTAMF